MADKNDILTLELDVETKRAIQESAKFQRAMQRQMDQLTAAIGKSSDATLSGAKKATKKTKEWGDSIEDTTDTYKDQTKEVTKLDQVIDKLKKKAEKASKKEKVGLKAQIALLEKERKVNVKVAKSVVKAGGGGGKKKGGGGTSDLGDAFRASMKSFSARDLKGTLDDVAKTFKEATKSEYLGKKGGSLRLAAAGMGARGAALGGPKGLAMKGAGAMTGAVGKLFQTLAKIGPMISLVSGALMGIVKLFVDLDAKVKEFNQEILTSASTSEFFYANLGQADVAAQELTDTLNAMRDAAHDIRFNFQWGILAEDHVKMLNVLTQEGVSLHSIKMEAEAAAKSIGKGTQTAEGFASAVADYEHQLVATSLAFSRSFGLPLSEINQLQAEMMRDLGMSLKDTQLAFHQVTRQASDSGVAANKFFAMIRGASQDLSLYNTRMEDAVKILGLMTKVMNPRNAQKFFQMTVQGLKNMGQDERLKLNLLTGAKGAKILEKDLKRREKTVNKEIGDALGMGADQVARQLSDPKLAKDIWKRLQSASPERAGALREASGQLRIDRKAAKRGVYGQAFAMENLSAGAALDALSAALVKWGGGKSLTEGAGTIGLTKMAENMGIGTEQLRNMMLLEDAVEDQRDALVAEGKMTREQAEKLSAADIMDTMSEEMKDQLKNSNKEINYAKDQTEMTRSWMKSFEMLVQFVMNELYNVMADILDTIQSFPFFGGGKAREKLNITRQIKGNMELVKILRETGDDLGKFRKEAIGSTTAKGVTGQITHFGEQFQKLEKEKAKQTKLSTEANTEEERKAAAKRVRSIEMEQEALQDNQRKLRNTIGSNLTKGGDKKVMDLLKGEKIGTEQQRVALHMKLGQGQNLQTALEGAGFNEAEITKIFEKAFNFKLSNEQFAGILKDFGKATGATPSPTEPKISAQQEAAAKSGATSAPGGGAAATTPGATTPPPTLDKENLSKALEKHGGDAATTSAEKLSQMTGLSTEQIQELQGVEKKLGEVKFDKAFLKSDLQRTMEQATLDAVRKALFEYYMYSAIEDRSKVADYLAKGGGDIGTFAADVGESAKAGLLATDVLEANAGGGMITGVRGGLAQVTAAAGEGLASVGPGERIVPAGGAPGGGTVTIPISVNGIGAEDLARVIRAKVIDGIAEYKRKERFT